MSIYYLLVLTGESSVVPLKPEIGTEGQIAKIIVIQVGFDLRGEYIPDAAGKIQTATDPGVSPFRADTFPSVGDRYQA